MPNTRKFISHVPSVIILYCAVRCQRMMLT
uniref:Uncharacterized protein n=1 Tax=Anguilla anguilla TaxID=7936 RepID=A0A0E9SDA2_ANGAN